MFDRRRLLTLLAGGALISALPKGFAEAKPQKSSIPQIPWELWQDLPLVDGEFPEMDYVIQTPLWGQEEGLGEIGVNSVWGRWEQNYVLLWCWKTHLHCEVGTDFRPTWRKAQFQRIAEFWGIPWENSPPFAAWKSYSFDRFYTNHLLRGTELDAEPLDLEGLFLRKRVFVPDYTWAHQAQVALSRVEATPMRKSILASLAYLEKLDV